MQKYAQQFVPPGAFGRALRGALGGWCGSQIGHGGLGQQIGNTFWAMLPFQAQQQTAQSPVNQPQPVGSGGRN